MKFKSINYIKSRPTFWAYINLLMDSTQLFTPALIQQLDLHFIFRPTDSNTKPHFKPVGLSLSEKSKSSKKKKTLTKELFYPQWNNDNLCYTPAFIIPQDRGMFEKLRDTFHQGYLNDIKNCFDQSVTIPINNIRLPYPRDQHYCGVCKIEYLDFEEHIISQLHMSNCRDSAFTRHIYDFCEQHGERSYLKKQDSTTGSKGQSEIVPIKKYLRLETQEQVTDTNSNPFVSKPKSDSTSSDNIQYQKLSELTKLSKFQAL